MPAISVIPKRVNEKFEVVLRYFHPDIKTGETISAVETTAANGLTKYGSPSISGNEVSQWIEGGTSANEYTLTFKTTISTGRILEHYVIVDVDD